MPLQSGFATYAADKVSQRQESDLCRKESYSHPSLSPGIFTLFCPHRVCYGFEIMRTCESPKIPFQIFRYRFMKPPKRIIYDNACKLHAYCLNRKPAFFQETQFAVDRFHWKGHIGCSLGYCLDTYTHLNIREINSQVNEQANVGLQRIKGQVSYMHCNNFIFHVTLALADLTL